MNKVWTVATTEFGSAVRTRAFIVGVLLMPVLMLGSVLVQRMAARQVDTTPKRFAVLDQTGSVYPTLAAAAEARNSRASASTAPEAESENAQAAFLPELIEPGGRDPEAIRLEVSERIRKGELFAFLEIPADLIDGTTPIRFYSDHPGESELPDWILATLTAEVTGRRFKDSGIDPAAVAKISKPLTLGNLGLVERSEGGQVKEAQEVDKVRTLAVPAVLMFLMFMVIMSSAPQLLNSVLEEKMSRISEVLLGSVSPFELMLGKLLGFGGVSLVLAALYVGGGYGVAVYYGYADALDPRMLAAFLLFQVLALLIFGSLYMAVGAACSELKDAQSLMTPVLLLTMLPVFVWTAVLKSPSSPFSVGASLFPPATPFLMLLRMALRPAPPAWQIVLSVVLTTLTALACVYAAGKIFRTGLLMQGKPPTFGELARWVVAR